MLDFLFLKENQFPYDEVVVKVIMNYVKEKTIFYLDYDYFVDDHIIKSSRSSVLHHVSILLTHISGV